MPSKLWPRRPRSLREVRLQKEFRKRLFRGAKSLDASWDIGVQKNPMSRMALLYVKREGLR